MIGGTLIVTKKISRHQDFVKKFEALGFPNVSITSLDKDALYFLIDEYPADLGMMFIINGAKSYVDINDGENQYEKGLLSVRNGNRYTSPSAQNRLEEKESQRRLKRKRKRLEIAEERRTSKLQL